jgi:ketosteroid isomerase-like protein
MSNVDAVLALFRSIGDEDLDAVGEHFADDAEWEEVPLGLRYRGPAGWRENVEYWQDGFTDGKAEVVNVIDAGDTVVVEYVGSGLNDGTLPTPQGPLPPTGRHIEARIVDVWEFEDGKIVRGRAYVGGLLAQMNRPAGAGQTSE